MPIARSPGWPDGAGLPSPAFRRWRFAQMQTVWGRANSSRVALTENGVRLARATRYLLSGILDGRPVRICAIGGLTSGAVANPAVTRTLIEELVADARARHGVSLALLFCSDIHHWQDKGRYQNITPADIQLGFPPTRRPGAPMVSIRAGEDRDLPAIVAMGQTRSAPFPFHLDRDVDFVKHGIVRERLFAGLRPTGTQELQFFVTEEGTIATAYVVLRVRADRWTILQCGDRDPSAARVGAILQALIARDPSQPAPTVRGWLPPGLTPPQAIRVGVTPSSPVLWARQLADEGSTLALSPESSLYWISDCF